MIPYEELDRALARWKGKAQGGVPEAPPIEAVPDSADVIADSAVEAAPLEIDPMASVPQPVEPPERTGEIDLAEIETYDD